MNIRLKAGLILLGIVAGSVALTVLCWWRRDSIWAVAALMVLVLLYSIILDTLNFRHKMSAPTKAPRPLQRRAAPDPYAPPSGAAGTTSKGERSPGWTVRKEGL